MEWCGAGQGVRGLNGLRDDTECVNRLCASTVTVLEPAAALLAAMCRQRPGLWWSFVDEAAPDERGYALTVHRAVSAAVAVLMARVPSSASAEERVAAWALMPRPLVFDRFRTPRGASAIVFALTGGAVGDEGVALLTPTATPQFVPSSLLSLGRWGDTFDTFMIDVANAICDVNPELYHVHGAAAQAVQFDFSVPHGRPPTPCVAATPADMEAVPVIKLRLGTLLTPDGPYAAAKARAESDLMMPPLPGRPETDATPFVPVPIGTVHTLREVRSTRPIDPTLRVPAEIASLLRNVLRQCDLHLLSAPAGLVAMRLLTQLLFTRTIRETLAKLVSPDPSVNPSFAVFDLDPKMQELHRHYTEMLTCSPETITMWRAFCTNYCTTVTGIPEISMYSDNIEAYGTLLRRVLSELACICMSTRCDPNDKFYCTSYNTLNVYVDLTALTDSGIHRMCNASTEPLGIGNNFTGFALDAGATTGDLVEGRHSPVDGNFFDMLSDCEFAPSVEDLEEARRVRFGGASFLAAHMAPGRDVHAEPLLYEACHILNSVELAGDVLLEALGFDEDVGTFPDQPLGDVAIPRI